ncbi:TrAP [Boerhavia golden mosaic virus]|nr:TrAP [Boerhavia golden mosaic virus]
MQHSCSSTPPSIKPQHRIAKRATRRRRLDLQCGCSIYVHVNCGNHGFTHRGSHHCASSAEWRVYLGDIKSPLFQDNQRRSLGISADKSEVPPRDQGQSQPEETPRTPQSLFSLPDLDNFDDDFWDSFCK